MKKFTYAIGDIHGRLDILKRSIELIENHRKENQASATVVFLGDYVDRGYESKRVCDILMAGPKTENTTWKILQGNHEVMALEAHHGGSSEMAFWLTYGGQRTADSFKGKIPYEYLRWMAGLPLQYYDGKRIFVHAGIKQGVPLSQNTETVGQWIRYPDEYEINRPEGYLVHGHTPIMDGPLILNSRCDLDVGGYQTGKCCVAVFDDEIEGKPISILSANLGYHLNV